MDVSASYALYVDYVQKMAERRQSVTTIYLSVNAAIVAALSFLFKDVQMATWAYQASSFALLVSGFVACLLWRKQIMRYSELLGWWYAQLRELEKGGPEELRLFTREYADKYAATKGRRPMGLTQQEVGLTWLFTVVYAVFGLVILLVDILSFV